MDMLRELLIGGNKDLPILEIRDLMNGIAEGLNSVINERASPPVNIFKEVLLHRLDPVSAELSWVSNPEQYAAVWQVDGENGFSQALAIRKEDWGIETLVRWPSGTIEGDGNLVYEMRPFDLNRVVRENLGLLRKLKGHLSKVPAGVLDLPVALTELLNHGDV